MLIDLFEDKTLKFFICIEKSVCQFLIVEECELTHELSVDTLFRERLDGYDHEFAIILFLLPCIPDQTIIMKP